jgi:hypothetical protein
MSTAWLQFRFACWFQQALNMPAVILSEAKDLRQIYLSRYAVLVLTDVVVENHARAIKSETFAGRSFASLRMTILVCNGRAECK